MSTEPSSLHKVLKDPTRSKLIILLNEKGSLSYTELLDFSEVGSTGRLNYHLKVLGDLLAKNDSGQYMLTEKGKLAVQLLRIIYRKQQTNRLKQVFPKKPYVDWRF